MADRRVYTLQPLVEAGVFHAGERVLSCSVAGNDFFAGANMPACAPTGALLALLDNRTLLCGLWELGGPVEMHVDHAYWACLGHAMAHLVNRQHQELAWS